MCDYSWNGVFLLEYGKVSKYRATEERMKVHIVGGGAVENNQNRK